MFQILTYIFQRAITAYSYQSSGVVMYAYCLYYMCVFKYNLQQRYQV